MSKNKKEKNKGWRSQDNLRRAELCPKPHEPIAVGAGMYECELCGMRMPGIFVDGYRQGQLDTYVKAKRVRDGRGWRGLLKKVLKR